jgi:hypothetical protein
MGSGGSLLGRFSNRGEDRHKLASRLSTANVANYASPSGRGTRTSCEHSGFSIIVLSNTPYIDTAFQQLRAEDYPTKAEDLARLASNVRPH